MQLKVETSTIAFASYGKESKDKLLLAARLVYRKIEEDAKFFSQRQKV